MHADTRAALDFAAALDEATKRSPGWQKALGLDARFSKLTYLHFHPAPPQTCQFPTCERPPIPRSHVLARGSVLERLASDGHVLAPRLTPGGSAELRRIGVNAASALPLYCTEHELLFAEFERAKLLSTPRHIVLQLMRSTAREVVKVSQFLDYVEQMQDAYSAAAEGAATVRPNIVEQLRAAEAALLRLRLEVAYLWASLRWVKGDLEQWLQNGHHTALPPYCSHFTFPGQLGFALSASSMLHPTNEHRFPVVLVAVPNGTKALVMGCTSEVDAASLQAYFAQFFHNRSSTLRSLGEWMGTDHWFASPTWWDELSPDRRMGFLAQLVAVD